MRKSFQFLNSLALVCFSWEVLTQLLFSVSSSLFNFVCLRAFLIESWLLARFFTSHSESIFFDKEVVCEISVKNFFCIRYRMDYLLTRFKFSPELVCCALEGMTNPMNRFYRCHCIAQLPKHVVFSYRVNILYCNKVLRFYFQVHDLYDLEAFFKEIYSTYVVYKFHLSVTTVVTSEYSQFKLDCLIFASRKFFFTCSDFKIA